MCVVIIFGKWVVLFVLVMIVLKFLFVVFFVNFISKLGVWCVDIIFVLNLILNDFSIFVVCCIVG